jgi:hypothetical protein
LRGPEVMAPYCGRLRAARGARECLRAQHSTALATGGGSGDNMGRSTGRRHSAWRRSSHERAALQSPPNAATHAASALASDRRTCSKNSRNPASPARPRRSQSCKVLTEIPAAAAALVCVFPAKSASRTFLRVKS